MIGLSGQNQRAGSEEGIQAPVHADAPEPIAMVLGQTPEPDRP